MTREEYEKLIKSDYWKGYSYSLIKERNFTCEDCGRQFPNERNKLQVHHLVYRDVNPWSYRPDEVVVLCEECHRKRHGIKNAPQQPIQDSHNGYSSSSSNVSWSEKPFDISSGRYNRNREYYKSYRKGFRFKFRYVLYAILLICILSIEWDNIFKQTATTDKKVVPTTEKIEAHKTTATKTTKKSGGIPSVNQSKENLATQLLNEQAFDDAESIEFEQQELLEQVDESSKEISTIELLESKNHADVVRRAQQAGVSTEGTTLEILERINHADVVKRAQRACVSTEGTTLEILERINHADVVKRAKQVGVSTEGTTLEILERINHADAVKRAKQVGVSTEGTTLEILERINHADVVKRAKQVGVSTEGTTLEILERINRKSIEEK